MMNNVLAIIPARKGSKGLPGKNKKNLLGKPLISYSIESALNANLTPFISTDDEDIIEIAKEYKIDCEYLRPSHLASDSAGMMDVVLDSINWIELNKKMNIEIVTLLQPTSPFRTSKDILESIELLKTSGAHSVVGVSKMWQHPYECLEIHGDNWTYLKKQEIEVVRRQDYNQNSEYYFINGAIYTIWRSNLFEERKFIFPDSKLYIMDEINTFDIDTPKDFAIAEGLMGFFSSKITKR
jgi:CMP-N,N'-diacetyllegionaminic acid synthase